MNGGLLPEGKVRVFARVGSRWRTWQSSSVNRRIFAAALTVGGLGMGAKIGLVVKDLVVADRFGASGELDAYLLAMSFPLFAISTLAGSLKYSLVPVYVQVRVQDGEVAARKLVGNVLSLAIPLFVGATALLAVAGPAAFGGHDRAAPLSLAVRLSWILLPIVFLSGFSNLWTAVLNAREKFVMASLAPIAVSVLPIAALLALGKISALDALLFGTLAGYAAEAIVLAGSAARGAIPVLPRWTGLDPATTRVLRAYLPMVAGSLISASSPLVDQLMANQLATGSVASLAYGNKVVAFAFSIALLPLGTAVLPHFSRMAATNDWHGLRHTLKTYSKLVLALSIPPTLLAMWFAQPIIRLLFERGAFGADDTRLVGTVLAAYLPQIPFALLIVLGVRVLSAMQQNRLLMVIAVQNVALNFAGDYVLMRWLGPPGIALATSIVAAASTVTVFLMVWTLLGRKDREAGDSQTAVD